MSKCSSLFPERSSLSSSGSDCNAIVGTFDSWLFGSPKACSGEASFSKARLSIFRSSPEEITSPWRAIPSRIGSVIDVTFWIVQSRSDTESGALALNV